MEQSGMMRVPFRHLKGLPSVVTISVSKKGVGLAPEVVPHNAGLIEHIHGPVTVEAMVLYMARMATLFIPVLQ